MMMVRGKLLCYLVVLTFNVKESSTEGEHTCMWISMQSRFPI